ncbi:SAM-dependent methyltransferase [Actinomadura sp. 3N508]|uniref:SAM-dependent methyltransferase n=1 Tax=Actinomadura sp. 3N508 TaxID=3375153 RepID=UPI003790C462
MPHFDEYGEHDEVSGTRHLTVGEGSWPTLWNYWAGFKDHYTADRQLGDLVAKQNPEIKRVAALRIAARTRLVRYMVAAASVRQIIFVDCDMPTHDEGHEVAHRIDPDVRVLYSSGHPVVMLNACVLMPDCEYVEVPATDPTALLAGAAEVLDLAEPVGVLLLNTFDVLDVDTARHITRTFAAALAPGSHVGIAHLTAKPGPPTSDKPPIGPRLDALFTARHMPPPVLRTPTEIAGLLDAWELLDPGVVPLSQWRPEFLLHQLNTEPPGDIRLVVAAARKRPAVAFPMTPAHLRVPGQPDPSNTERSSCP